MLFYNLVLSVCPIIYQCHYASNSSLCFSGFKYEGVQNQLNASLKSMQVDSVDIFYLHWPDHKLPVEDTLRAVNDLYNGMLSSFISHSPYENDVCFHNMRHWYFHLHE